MPPCFRFKTTFHLESEDPSLKRKGFQSVLNSHTSSYYVLLMFGLQVARPATVVLERARSSVRQMDLTWASRFMNPWGGGGAGAGARAGTVGLNDASLIRSRAFQQATACVTHTRVRTYIPVGKE